jgi:tRNA(fMet)-specific endonuclease VapC
MIRHSVKFAIRHTRCGTLRANHDRVRHQLQILAYTSQAESLYQHWKQQGIHVSTHDMRIAAMCVAHNTKLITRNRRDFERIPGLEVEFWE